MKAAKSAFIIMVFLYMLTPFVQSAEDARFYYEKAEENFKSGDYTNAAKYYNDARCVEVSLLDAWYGEAFSYFKMGQYEESDEICDQVLRRDLPNPSCLDRFAILAGDSATAFEKSKGFPLVNAGDEEIKYVPEGYLKGMNYYDEAIKLNPNSTNAWNRKGIALAEIGDYTGSIACFDRAIKINSSQAEAWNNKGVSLDYWGKHRESMDCYDEAIKINPLLAEAWYNKAKTLALNITGYVQAKEYYNKSIELAPRFKGELMTWIYVETKW
jgi:tetratricopeptide (TPR) repeat protein